MLSYIDPIPGGGHSIHFIPKATAIAQMQAQDREEWHRRFPDRGPYSDAMALQDFITVNWAEELDVTIERMAIAMYCDMGMDPEEWEKVDQERWHLQAKAALKALGVPLP